MMRTSKTSTREGFSTYLSSETLITASSCGIVTAILTVSLHPSSLFTKAALMCFLLEVSSSVSFIVAAIFCLLSPGKRKNHSHNTTNQQYRKWSETELQWRHNFRKIYKSAATNWTSWIAAKELSQVFFSDITPVTQMAGRSKIRGRPASFMCFMFLKK